MWRKIAGEIDFFFNKVLPKKFIVFAVASVLVFTGRIQGDHWFYIALGYFGVNVLAVLARKGEKSE
jgi:hypothetical protein